MAAYIERIYGPVRVTAAPQGEIADKGVGNRALVLILG
jgi:hypothetical protein